MREFNQRGGRGAPRGGGRGAPRGGGRGAPRGGRGGAGGGPRGAGKQVMVIPHRFKGVYIAKGQ